MIALRGARRRQRLRIVPPATTILNPTHTDTTERARRLARWATSVTLAALGALALATEPGLARVNEFPALMQHVEQTVASEKQRFGVASACTQWFYDALRKKPTPPTTEGVAWRPTRPHIPSPDTVDRPIVRITESFTPETDCPRRFPTGLEAARLAYGRSQTSLSIALTFYQLALLADGDDDQAYSSAELGDFIEALALPSVTASMDAGAALRTLFDRWVDARDLEPIMQAMSALHDQGYRLTPADRTQLNQVME
ncbi:MAG: hypothetical protein U0172_09005 [Nitrospiraceae bacterium]